MWVRYVYINGSGYVRCVESEEKKKLGSYDFMMYKCKHERAHLNTLHIHIEWLVNAAQCLKRRYRKREREKENA